MWPIGTTGRGEQTAWFRPIGSVKQENWEIGMQNVPFQGHFFASVSWKSSLDLSCWTQKWWQHVPLKCFCEPTKLYDVKTLKATVWEIPTMRTKILSIVLLYFLSRVIRLSDLSEYTPWHTVSPRAILILRIRVFCDVVLHHSMSGFWHFEGSWCFNLKGLAVQD